MRFAWVACTLLSLVPAQALTSGAEEAGTIKGVVVDINDAQIVGAQITFTDENNHEYQSNTRPDGTYSISLRPGIYGMSLRHWGFCTFRRGRFAVKGGALIQMDSQMWVCPSDTEFIKYAELKEVPNTQLRPLVVFGSEELDGEQRWYRGPKTHDDGTRHPRKYPAIATFNLVTVKADEIVYNAEKQIITALGNATWEEGAASCAGERIVTHLVGLNPLPDGCTIHAAK